MPIESKRNERASVDYSMKMLLRVRKSINYRYILYFHVFFRLNGRSKRKKQVSTRRKGSIMRKIVKYKRNQQGVKTSRSQCGGRG